MSFDVDVTIRRGERTIAARFLAGPGVTVLFGQSGAGKTSLLHAVAGLVRPDAGRIAVGGRVLFDAATGVDVPAWQRGAGYVFQDARLFPHMTVRRNLHYAAPAGDIDHDRIAFLDIGHLLDRRPATLSGGEARRVAIGRALFSDPAFLLLDEPLSSLDGARRDEVMGALEHLRDTATLPILLVTHDRGEADRLAAQIIEIG